MSARLRSARSFASLQKAWKGFPRAGGLRVLVFNRQGQPVIQYSRATGASTTIDERECALGTELVRNVYQSVESFSGDRPGRAAFFFDDRVVAVERSDPFILLVFLPRRALRMNGAIEAYLARLVSTLQEELT